MNRQLAIVIVTLSVISLLTGCGGPIDRLPAEPFGTTKSGEEIMLYSLANSHGMKATIINFGAIVVSLHVADKNGQFDDVVIGYDNIKDYQERSHNFGATIGRYASRITNATFTIDGETFTLPNNSGPHCVHGGPIGFDKVVWKAIDTRAGKEPSITLQYVSEDGEMGFPGELTTKVTYTITHGNELRIEYEANTTKPTPVNFTNHSYFNLMGDGQGNVLDHSLQINASRTPTAPDSVPTGSIETLDGTPIDFRTPTPIGQRIDHPTFESRRGYNHYYILDRQNEMDLFHAATLEEPRTGRAMTVWTTEPGLQLYTGNWLNPDLTGKSGTPYVQYGGICLETQHYPDSPNQPHFPNTILRPGETFHSTTVYRFETPSSVATPHPR